MTQPAIDWKPVKPDHCHDLFSVCIGEGSCELDKIQIKGEYGLFFFCLHKSTWSYDSWSVYCETEAGYLDLGRFSDYKDSMLPSLSKTGWGGIYYRMGTNWTSRHQGRTIELIECETFDAEVKEFVIYAEKELEELFNLVLFN